MQPEQPHMLSHGPRFSLRTLLLVLLVEFSAPRCLVCSRGQPEIEALARNSAWWASAGRLQVDLFPEVAEQYQVAEVPTWIVFHQGEPVKRLVGRTPVEVIRESLDVEGKGVASP